MNHTLKRWLIIAMLTAMSMALSIAESFIPVFIPGVKLGLANVIILIMLYEFKWYEAGLTDLLRILLTALIRGTILSPTFFMSLAGGVASFLVMLLLSRFKFFSPVGVSVVGSVFHCGGQILVAMVLVSNVNIVYYLPFIAVLSVATGVLSGLVVRIYLKRSITSRFLG